MGYETERTAQTDPKHQTKSRPEEGGGGAAQAALPVGEEQADAEAAEAEEEGPLLGDGASQHQLVSSCRRSLPPAPAAAALVEAHLPRSLSQSLSVPLSLSLSLSTTDPRARAALSEPQRVGGSSGPY